MLKCRDVGAVDMMCYLFTPKRERERWESVVGEADEFAIMARSRAEREGRKYEPPKEPAPGYTPEQYVKLMDEQGIDKTLVACNKMYSYRKRIPIGGFYAEEEDVYEAVKDHPGRLYGFAGYDPWKIMESVRRVEKGGKEWGFKGGYIHAYGHGIRYDDRKYYPLYETCSSLGVPVSMQVGHSAEEMPSEVGHPISMDMIAIDFPDLVLIGSHTGWPWWDELIAMASKHPNVYMDISAWPPGFFEPSLWKNIDGRCRSKTMWGSNGGITRALEYFDQMDELLTKDESKRAILRENAIRVYKL